MTTEIIFMKMQGWMSENIYILEVTTYLTYLCLTKNL